MAILHQILTLHEEKKDFTLKEYDIFSKRKIKDSDKNCKISQILLSLQPLLIFYIDAFSYLYRLQTSIQILNSLIEK